jgi:hypothetical protein
MKNITINGFQMAIFKVENNSLHITVTSVHNNRSVFSSEFKKDTQAELLLYNHFSETFNRLAECYSYREVKNNQNTRINSLIIIIK